MGEYSDYVFASDFGFVKLKGETAEKIKVPDSLTPQWFNRIFRRSLFRKIDAANTERDLIKLKIKETWEATGSAPEWL